MRENWKSWLTRRHESAPLPARSGRVGQQFDAIVTGASEKGTWVRIRRPAVDGRVIRGESGLDVGDRTRVELVGADVDRASSTSPESAEAKSSPG